MHRSEYERAIKHLCLAAGVDDYREILEGQHIEMEGHVVGLIHDEDDLRSNQLSIYVELDAVAPIADSQFCLRLLHANVARGHGLKGHFGVHPETGNATYCVQIDTGSGLEGEALMDFLQAQVRDAPLVFELLKQ